MTLTAGDLMNGDILRVHASWSVSHLTEFLTRHGISGAPVVSDEGRLIGVVSLTDVARITGTSRHKHGEEAHEYYLYGPAFAYGAEPRTSVDHTLTVNDIMTPTVFDVPVNATAKEVADMMLRGHIHRVFVTESGMVIGVITAFDMLRALV